MTDTPWTPGPWLIGEDQCVDETWSIITTSGGSIISNVNDRHDRLANARLIAAAPDMAEALERIIGLDSHIDASIRSSGPDRVVEYGALARIALAALAKARGQL